MTMSVCDGCWSWGDAPHTCTQTVIVDASDGRWYVPCACQVERACRGNQNAMYVRVRVDEAAS